MNTKDTYAFDPNVFALDEIEKEFGADDTAWQFLKWNPEYQAAFRELSQKESSPSELEAIVSHVKTPYPGMVACAHDNTCRERFGISAWLNPDSEHLPELKNDGDSWFFPLRRVEQQDSAQVLRQRGQLPEKLEYYPWLTFRETPFGYDSVSVPHPNLNRAVGRKKKAHEPRLLHVAFDCSIPVEGQLTAFEALAHKHREFWNGRICSTTAPTAIVESVEWSGIFRADDFANRDWARTAVIDVLGPIKKQINLCREKLTATYKDLDKESQKRRMKHPGLNEPDMIRHFGERFPMPKPSRDSEPALSSNRYLKALLRIAEHLPTDAFAPDRIIKDYKGLGNVIAKEIGISRDDATAPQWMEDFEAGMHRTHLRRAKYLVNHFYGWLVHAEVSLSGHMKKTKR
ncbi:hypothetical protein [Paraburkholderia kururiensis]|uniref:Uncharacterized protein n=1 Tax=Paraburkholderia kururiensis TaxID=984307 RepID=A0ABZ0WDQ8_9BURK|nr:hypothetical protein [Paraburkholderia kururiensis]WQD75489.1 hypothetical protein U0042_15075 [Paraburkholderia kururiensis]